VATPTKTSFASKNDGPPRNGFGNYGETDPVCNLYSITTNQAAIIALFRVINC
jgi:hypothetical protein